MARHFEPTPAQEKNWSKFVASRPKKVRAVAEKFWPWELYRLKTTGSRVTLYSFGEHDDGSVTLTVNITGQFNLLTFDRQVFGIKPEDLEPCELPSKDEMLGAMLTHDADIEAFVDEVRPIILAAKSSPPSTEPNPG